MQLVLYLAIACYITIVWREHTIPTHGNPELFYDWDVPGFATAVENCAHHSYAPVLCYLQRAYMQIFHAPSSVFDRLQVCTSIQSDEHKLSCLLSLASGTEGPDMALVSACESLEPTKQFACVAGVGGASLEKITVPCEWFQYAAHVTCEFARNICRTRLRFDCFYILEKLALAESGKKTMEDFSWLPQYEPMAVHQP